jgi:hypothetical protein
LDAEYATRPGAAARGEHGPELGPHAEVGAVEVHGHRPPPRLGRGGSDIGEHARRPGDVGSEVEPPVVGHDPPDDGVDRPLVADVEGHDAVGLGEVGGDHRGAPGAQQLHGGGTDARRPARDEGDLAVHAM